MPTRKEICVDLSDTEIIVKSREDINYFACLYEKYEQRLMRYISKISKANYDEAKDILQESFIKAWINLNEFDTELKLSSWLYRIVHNETISFCRKKKSFGKNKKVPVNENNIPNYETELKDDFENTEGFVMYDKILEILPIKYKEVLVLKFLEQMNYDEISDVLKIPEGTVAARINRAKKMFKNLAEKENY